MTWKINIRGQVQGVGFRPFIWRAALDQQLTGLVANGLQGVIIKINGTEEQVAGFQRYVLENAPAMARITGYSRTLDDDTCFQHFAIAESEQHGHAGVSLTPDVALCPACRDEIHDPADRRYRYPFTTCTVCGPRYSILSGLPYDRRLTTMQRFEMCAACAAEYADPADRRYYAQTNSCPDCGIRLAFFQPGAMPAGREMENEAALRQTLAAWRSGAIVAIKGLSGYLLTCDATDAAAVATLRTRKGRPTKPFAVMYPDAAVLQRDAVVSPAALELLAGPAAPIVLLELHPTGASGLDRAGVAPGLHAVGAMLPNAPLLDLLLRDFGRPIVATSGNRSGSPLFYEDAAAINGLAGIADYILLHDRDIGLPQDDSVVALRGRDETGPPAPVVLRRARGLAPAFIQPGLRVPAQTVLTLGAEMKSTCTLAHLGNVHIGAYTGDLADFDIRERFDHHVRHLLGLFDARPDLVAGDLHPGYFTTQLGQTLAHEWQVPFRAVQHHEAHLAAVLAENDLLESAEPVLGVIWDGTGYGRDGQIWGGEFFTYHPQPGRPIAEGIRRTMHFGYFPQLLGDKMVREPRLSALAVCSDLPVAQGRLRPKFSETEWALYRKLCAQPGSLRTSSVGRMFDAVASLVGLADRVHYEGEAAVLLEDVARQHCRHYGYAFEPAANAVMDTGALFTQILDDLERGKTPGYVAARFHFILADTVKQVANQLNIKKIAFSGGVFQNTLLLDMIQDHLYPDHLLFFHRQLSPNDENISFGQWVHSVF